MDDSVQDLNSIDPYNTYFLFLVLPPPLSLILPDPPLTVKVTVTALRNQACPRQSCHTAFAGKCPSQPHTAFAHKAHAGFCAHL